MAQPKAITLELIKLVNSALTIDLQVNVPPNDPSRAGFIRPGLLQDDPTIKKINVLTFQNDPDEEGMWHHNVIAGGHPDQITRDPPSYEIGGGEMWYRRFTVLIEMFFSPTIQREPALELGSVVLARAERTLNLLNVALGTDDFGESSVDLRVMKSALIQGGGEGQFIYHGKIWFLVLTEKES